MWEEDGVCPSFNIKIVWILEIRRVTDTTLGEEKCSVLKPDKSPDTAAVLHVGGGGTPPCQYSGWESIVDWDDGATVLQYNEGELLK